MKDKIKTLGKKARKKMQIQKTLNCSTVSTKRLHVLLKFTIRWRMKTFQRSKKWTNTCKIKKKKKTIKSLTVSVVKIILKATTKNKKLGKNGIMTITMCVR